MSARSSEFLREDRDFGPTTKRFADDGPSAPFLGDSSSGFEFRPSRRFAGALMNGCVGAVKRTSRSQWNVGYGADSGPSRGHSFRRALRPIEASKAAFGNGSNTSTPAVRRVGARFYAPSAGSTGANSSKLTSARGERHLLRGSNRQKFARNAHTGLAFGSARSSSTLRDDGGPGRSRSWPVWRHSLPS